MSADKTAVQVPTIVMAMWKIYWFWCPNQHFLAKRIMVALVVMMRLALDNDCRNCSNQVTHGSKDTAHAHTSSYTGKKKRTSIGVDSYSRDTSSTSYE